MLWTKATAGGRNCQAACRGLSGTPNGPYVAVNVGSGSAPSFVCRAYVRPSLAPSVAPSLLTLPGLLPPSTHAPSQLCLRWVHNGAHKLFQRRKRPARLVAAVLKAPHHCALDSAYVTTWNMLAAHVCLPIRLAAVTPCLQSLLLSRWQQLAAQGSSANMKPLTMTRRWKNRFVYS